MADGVLTEDHVIFELLWEELEDTKDLEDDEAHKRLRSKADAMADTPLRAWFEQRIAQRFGVAKRA